MPNIPFPPTIPGFPISVPNPTPNSIVGIDALGNGIAVPSSGSVSGRSGASVLIQQASLVAQTTDYNTITWAPGLYQSLHLDIQQTAQTGGSGLSTITLVGLTGAWTSRQILVGAASVTEDSFSRANVSFGWNGTNRASGSYDFDIPSFPKIKSFKKTSLLEDANALQIQSGTNADVTHDVSGLTFVKFGAGTWDFNYRLWGVLA
jgi:hypothetical protein